MPGKDDEIDLTEEFEWALKDPTEEKVAELGEVVSIITNKLIAAISDIQKTVYELSQQVDSIESTVENLKARGVAAPSAAAMASSAASAASDMAMAPKPRPAAAPPSGPGGMMGELKALLAARKRKADEAAE
jgi:L-cysteine desulfidase